MSIMYSQTTESRVSLREVKEETYRALRATGYPWGEAQAAGRLVAVCEALWGTGVGFAVHDSRRWWVARRGLQVRRDGQGIYLRDRRKTSAMIAGNHAVAMAVGCPGETVFVRGGSGGKEVAAAVWDLHTGAHSVVWGGVTAGKLTAFSVDDEGHLYWHSHIPQESIGRRLNAGEWFVRQGEISGGELLISTEHRQQCLATALRGGVVVAPNTWKQLMKKARKFLVAE